MLIGYARVSTADQNLALPRDALTEAGCAKIFTEQISGAVTERPASHDALEFARSGVRGIGFRSPTEAPDTTTAQGRLVFHMIGALADV
jgi:DNA invertase Pin-like site-specific DNA recombinase